MTALSLRVHWWRLRDRLHARFDRGPLSAFEDEDLRKTRMLATYNAEVARGLVHTAEWRRSMEELQRWYEDLVVHAQRIRAMISQVSANEQR